MHTLYPPLEPYKTHTLKRDGHLIHVEECGHANGIPILFLHGGPGSGCKPHHRCFFDPDYFRIILLDQRGSGRSSPPGQLTHNRTDDLLGDLEALRGELGIDHWALFGGSWGATLALLYAQAFPQRVLGLILRGTFLARQADLDWFIASGGVRRIYPEAWEQLVRSLPESEREHPLLSLYTKLTGSDELACRRAARAWEHWGGQVTLGADFDLDALGDHVTAQTVNQARIELHYAVNGYFLAENQILEECDRITTLPLQIIHGRRDLVCPVESAFTLHQRLPGSTLKILPNAGHIAAGAEMIDALVEATMNLTRLLGSRV